jgi:hypothetical protein
MNDASPTPDPLLDALFAQARQQRPDTARAEYAFETRLLARLSKRSESAPVGLLAWRLLPFFTVIVLILGVCQVETSHASQEAEQAAALQNPDAVDLFSSLE